MVKPVRRTIAVSPLGGAPVMAAVFEERFASASVAESKPAKKDKKRKRIGKRADERQSVNKARKKHR